ncbi:hypothetical protein MF271_22480 (plasmid) [Deinococcus sp. KNUC1210]|uniref:hypothetical protein n=1 Tax=Deinococcus sp. KNUC1210 TaxID=2917691 RepID=UPI001EF0F6F7|nr:hypothetical protein [Deinococcus sp. KNUC1210]ULH18235.1 hypothetical protein MF271_22480 [Deinococcus sp. KNUC1210]
MKARPSRLAQVALGYLGITSILVGIWAQMFPRAFYDRFPGVGIWVAGDGPYNEHLVRDVGGLNLCLALLLWAAWRRPGQLPRPVVGWAVLASAVPHVLYHSVHIHTVASRTDQISSLAGLLWTVTCAGILVLRPSTGRSDDGTSRDYPAKEETVPDREGRKAGAALDH